MAIHVPAWRYGLAYALWIVTFAAGLACAALIHNTFFLLASVFQWDPALVRAGNQGVVLGLGVILLLLLIFLESYYRIGARRDRLGSRFLLVTFIQLLVLAGVHLLRFGVTWANGVADVTPLFLIAAELVAAAVVWRLRQRLKSV